MGYSYRIGQVVGLGESDNFLTSLSGMWTACFSYYTLPICGA